MLGGRMGSRASHRPITVQNRPVTQQGLQGVRPMSTRGEFPTNARLFIPGSDQFWRVFGVVERTRNLNKNAETASNKRR